MSKTLQAKLLVESVPEFKYLLGDLRLHFLRHVVESCNVATYMTRDEMTRRAGTYQHSRVFRHMCVNGKRTIVYPAQKEVLEAIQRWVAGGNESDFIMFPVLAVSKTACNAKPMNRSVHAMYALYNRRTNELERIDLRKYHVKDFSIKPVYAKGFQQVLVKVFNRAKKGSLLMTEDEAAALPKMDPKDKCAVVGEHDVPSEFMRRHKIAEARYAFPLYMMAYVRVRCAHPEKRASEVERMVCEEVSWDDVVKYWREWTEAVATKGKCGKKLLNPETHRCKSAKSMMTAAANTGNGVLTVAKLGLEEVAQYADMVNKNTAFEHLGGPEKAWASAAFVMDKHKNGHLLPSAIKWRYSQSGKEWQLRLPGAFWESWKEGMLNDKVRFIVALLSVNSTDGGAHANALIYDKDTHEMERFDSLGFNLATEYNIGEFDRRWKAIMAEKEGTHVPNEGVTYLTPIDYCPAKARIFQSKEIEFIGFEDLRGNCAVWRTWYLDARMANPHLKRDELVRVAMKRLDETMPLTRFIKQYQMYVTKQLAKSPSK